MIHGESWHFLDANRRTSARAKAERLAQRELCRRRIVPFFSALSVIALSMVPSWNGAQARAADPHLPSFWTGTIGDYFVLASVAMVAPMLWLVRRRKRRANQPAAELVQIRSELEDRIAYLARHDALTGLANRSAFIDWLEEAFATARRGGSAFAILYIDLDDFKDINDAFGPAKGDMLLKAAAGRLDGLLRETDTVVRFGLARLGGDEFAILQTGVSAPADAGALAARLIRLLAQRFVVGGDEFHITASIGISLYDPSLTKAEEMISRADLALYRAKDEGRNQYRFHSNDLDESVRERVSIAEDLHAALSKNQLELYYQPQVEASSGRIIGLEALLRWNHPVRGLIKPSAFIATAEKTGIVVAIGHWIREEVCRQIGAWRVQGIMPTRIAVNVSGMELKLLPHFDRDVAETLKKWNVDSAAIEIEITESALVETTTAHDDLLLRLHNLGVRFTVDDFGTGYSSLDYLRSYPVSRLKIAQQFIADVTDNPGNAAIVRATISLARELGIEFIAEGVETAAQLQFLQTAGCHNIQGFYFSVPVCADQAGELLRRGTIEHAEAA